MALTLRKYNIELEVVSKGLKEVEKSLASLKRGFKGLTGGGSSLIGTFAKLTAGYLSFQGAMRGSQFIFDTIAGFESLEATLVTLNGASTDLAGAQRLANEEFDQLRKIALDTPFTVEKVGQAFAQLKARGVDVSDTERVMKSVGNTAAAFGQDITSFANAVGQAIAGENERLKQFGISATTKGKQVTFTYKGITKTVNRNIKEISDTLLSFGDSTAGGPFSGVFAKGAELQAKTLGGAFSRLKDIIQIFVFELGRSGLAEALVDLINDMRGVAEGAFDLAKRLGATAGRAVTKFTALLKELPAKFKAVKERLMEFYDALPEFVKVDNVSEAINRISAALAVLAGSAAIGKIITFVSGIVGAFAAFTLGEALIIIGGIAAMAATIFLIVDDIITWIRGGDSLLKDIFEKFKAAESGPMAAVRGLFEALFNLGKTLWDAVIQPIGSWLMDVLPALLDVISVTFGAQMEMAVHAVTQLINFFTMGIEVINAGVTLIQAFVSYLSGGPKQVDKVRAAFMRLLGPAERITNTFKDMFGTITEVPGKLNNALGNLFGQDEGLFATPDNIQPMSAGSSGILAGTSSLGGSGANGGTVNATATTNAVINVQTSDPEAAASKMSEKLEESKGSTNKQTIAAARSKYGGFR